MDDLLAELRADLDAHGEYPMIEDLLNGLRRRGTSAQRQRQRFAITRSLRETTRAAVTLTLSQIDCHD
jgi:hypothetical protein